MDDAVKCGADALVTLCPMCDRVLRKPTTERGLRKIYITDLVRMALGEKTFPDWQSYKYPECSKDLKNNQHEIQQENVQQPQGILQ